MVIYGRLQRQQSIAREVIFIWVIKAAAKHGIACELNDYGLAIVRTQAKKEGNARVGCSRASNKATGRHFNPLRKPFTGKLKPAILVRDRCVVKRFNVRTLYRSSIHVDHTSSKLSCLNLLIGLRC